MGIFQNILMPTSHSRPVKINHWGYNAGMELKLPRISLYVNVTSKEKQNCKIKLNSIVVKVFREKCTHVFNLL